MPDLLRFVHGEERRVHSGHLAGANSNRRAVPRERFLVSGEGAGAGGQPARRSVLDDRAASGVAERIAGEESALEIEEIVERQLLASFLIQRGNPVVPALDVKGGALSRIFSVT